MNPTRNIVVAFLLFCGVLTNSFGQILFSQTYTGQQLSDLNGTETAFNITPTSLGGGAIGLDPTSNEQILFSWGILPAAPRGPLVFNVTVDYTPLSADNDPVFLLSDGTLAVGLVRMDTGVVHAQGYNDNGTTISNRTETSNVISGLGDVDPFSFQVLLEDESAGASLIDYTEGVASTPDPTSIAYAGVLDTDQALSFLMASSSVASDELYQLNAINVTVTAIPEPRTAALLAGLLAAGLAVRRRMPR